MGRPEVVLDSSTDQSTTAPRHQMQQQEYPDGTTSHHQKHDQMQAKTEPHHHQEVQLSAQSPPQYPPQQIPQQNPHVYLPPAQHQQQQAVPYPPTNHLQGKSQVPDHQLVGHDQPVQFPPATTNVNNHDYASHQQQQGINHHNPNQMYPPNGNGHQPMMNGGATTWIPMQSQQPMYANGGNSYAVPNRMGNVGWTTGLFDCMEDPNNALLTAFYPCSTFGQIAEVIDEGHTTCGTSGIIYGAIGFSIGLPCLLSCGYRTKLRNRYELVEAPAPDWISHFFCEWCALCQEYRELRNRGLDPALGWHGNQMRIKRMQQQPQVVMNPPTNQTMA